METDQAGTRRRRNVLLKNTYLSAAGYAIAWMAITAARVLDLASYS
jgi:hypothetical protein